MYAADDNDVNDKCWLKWYIWMLMQVVKWDNSVMINDIVKHIFRNK